MRRARIKPPFAKQKDLPGRRVKVAGTPFSVFLYGSIHRTFSLGPVNFTIVKNVATPDRPIPDSWLRRI